MVFTLCNYPTLLMADSPIEDYPLDVQQEHMVFMALVDSYPGLLDHLMNGEEEDLIQVGELLGKGASGQAVIPPLAQNIKSDQGFDYEVTGVLLCPAGLDWSDAQTKESLKTGETAVHGDQWPMFLYAGCIYDPEDPWKGLLRSEILIFGFKHVFTSPSSVDKEPKATHSSNTYLHSMKSVTKGCLAYIATQVQFSLSEEVGDLMMWWTQFVIHLIKLKLQSNTLYSHVFPNSLSSQCSVSKNSTLLKI
ncbi:uncharacterized protein BJ212DRAFT_1444806 [Suillus subaureus]|uniref:Uncharacterized protein n=1 Tax=Suillus subaureus TaxID=48587 RepID=A0A9P7JIH7_9AGAM|nr:uncharacterized protein BJ212DRAFT_1444806 [Suillus subaureus]KAG1823891.1 hypothetical protein BJ212DRAFT_1444806 [Suillus subaureus]